MTSRNPASEEAVVKALASRGELTSAEIAAATGLGRSTAGKTLTALERAGMARRSRGAREGGRRLPDRWSLTTRDEQAPARLRPGELDAPVLEFVSSQGNDTSVTVTAVANALGRSAGAVGNCLVRLAAAARLEQVSEHPRRYRIAAPANKRRDARRSRRDKS